MNGQVRIESMFAFIVLDSDNSEGIPAISKNGMALPLVGADMNRIDSLRPYAKQFARLNNVKVTLVKFTHREELEVIE